MSEINNLINSPLNVTTSTNNTNESAKVNDLGKDAFLKLMITQLQNQDPLNPAKNEDFIAQLAQFSSVEGIQNINTSIGDLATSFKSSQALEASSLVGRQVQVSSNEARLNDSGEVKGTIALNSDVSDIKLSIEDTTGNVIRFLDLGSHERGDVNFSWDGRDNSGARMVNGAYTLSANGIADGQDTQLNLAVGANVNSVTIGQNNDMLLNVDGIGAIALSDVKKFL
jgi:flagellar basal-body rod modification protein FlgD